MHVPIHLFLSTRPRPNRWSSFSHMVSVRSSQKQSQYAQQLTPCLNVMRTHWLGPGGSSLIRQTFSSLFYQNLNIVFPYWYQCPIVTLDNIKYFHNIFKKYNACLLKSASVRFWLLPLDSNIMKMDKMTKYRPYQRRKIGDIW